MKQKVFHGTLVWEVWPLLGANFGAMPYVGLCITDTAERAAKYANSRATGIVTRAGLPLKPHAAICVIETDEEISWIRRPEEYPNLNQCESCIISGRVVGVAMQECERPRCRCHDDAEKVNAYFTR